MQDNADEQFIGQRLERLSFVPGFEGVLLGAFAGRQIKQAVGAFRALRDLDDVSTTCQASNRGRVFVPALDCCYADRASQNLAAVDRDALHGLQ